MNTFTFLEYMANDLHYSDAAQLLIATQPVHIREAFFFDDADRLFANKPYLADSCAVVQV